ncbi:MAG TPA: ribulose phosphate epimerase [Nannocystaceae bacterium]|nr:ribulose phosphate epimerase [Nannocystaceae bacterium]
MRAILIQALFLAACGSDRPLLTGGDEQTSTTTSSTGSSTEFPSDTTSSGADATSSPTTTFAESSGPSSTDASACPFVCPVDLGDAIIEDCDLWAQDCPLGMKCMPWANDGGNARNGTRCSPIADDPGRAGEPCTVEGSDVSGIDDCERGAMCWNVNENNIGACVEMCSGSPDAPVCADANAECTVWDDGLLIFCMLPCDPLTQDCAEVFACYPFGDLFACLTYGQGGLYGQPCEYANVCDPRMFCDELGGVPDCAGSIGCCNAFCDLAADDPNAMCPDAAQGQTCVAWFERGEAPPGFETVGRCALP